MLLSVIRFDSELYVGKATKNSTRMSFSVSKILLR